MKPKTVCDLLVGLRVRTTHDCDGVIKGNIYTVINNPNSSMRVSIGGTSNYCACVSTWELVDELSIKKAPHKHVYKCECGEEK